MMPLLTLLLTTALSILPSPTLADFDEYDTSHWFSRETFRPATACPAKPYFLSLPERQCSQHTDIFTYPFEEYAPWTKKPLCIRAGTVAATDGELTTDTYCAYTKADFAGGRGITVLTTPNVAKEMEGYPAFADPAVTADMNDLVGGEFGPPPYERRAFPGKGVGLVANRTIVRGERIMQETPTLVYNRDMFTWFADQYRLSLSWHGVYRLPDETRDELLALHKHHGGDEVDDLMRTNAFGAYYGDQWALHNNVFPRISRFNHDCRPNAHYYFDAQTMTQYVHAIRDIMPGEEILINYTDTELTYEERRQATMLSWGFDCKCSLCRQPKTHLLASDQRIRMIKVLKEILNDWTVERSDRGPIAEALVTLYEEERLWVPIATGYEAASYAYSVAGDEPRVIKWASKAHEAMVVLYGADHPLTQDMYRLMLDPKNHRTWMYKAPKTNETESATGTEEGGPRHEKTPTGEAEGEEKEKSKWKFF